MIEFKLPELGENIKKAEVIRVLVAEGDRIQADQNVLEVESEKAAMPLSCPHAGRVAKLHVKEGDTITVGQRLLSIEADEAKTKEQLPTKPAAPARAAPPPTVKKAEASPSHPAADGKPAESKTSTPESVDEGKSLLAAGPATRRLARELGVDLHRVQGSGAGGRITPEDVQAAVRQRGTARVETPALPDFAKWGQVERQPLNAIGRASAKRLALAWQLVPHVTQHTLADITELESARRNLESKRADGDAKITVTALAVKAVVAALKAFPQFNSSYDPAKEELILKRYYHIGVAVDTPQGLLVPVIRDADRKSARMLAAELAELADKARRRALSVEQLQGGSFTISNLGGIGGTAFTPIVNYPEVAILGITRSQWQLVQRDGKIDNRLMLPLSLSYDHRVINGADGARFVTKLADLLGDPLALLIEI